MRKVVLLDGTVVDNLSDSTTANSIVAERPTYGEAGAVRDLFTPENSKTIRILNEQDEEVAVGANLILLGGCKIDDFGSIKRATIETRYKTPTELMQDEIVELQEAIIGE